MLVRSWKLNFRDGFGVLICLTTSELHSSLRTVNKLKTWDPFWENHLLEVSGVPCTESEPCGLVTVHLDVSVKLHCLFISWTPVILHPSVGINLWSRVKGVAFFTCGIQRCTLAFEIPVLCCVFHLQYHLTNRSSGVKLMIPRCVVALVIIHD